MEVDVLEVPGPAPLVVLKRYMVKVHGRVVKSFVREDYEEEKFKKRNDALRGTAERTKDFTTRMAERFS